MNLVPRLAFVMVAVAVAALAVSTAFAQAALPGQGLYAWKLSAERAWRATASNPVAVDLTLADRRTDEILSLVTNDTQAAQDDKNKAMAESAGIAAYTDVLDRLASEADGPDRDQIITVLEAHQERLLHAGIHVQKLDDIVSHARGKGQKP